MEQDQLVGEESGDSDVEAANTSTSTDERAVPDKTQGERKPPYKSRYSKMCAVSFLLCGWCAVQWHKSISIACRESKKCCGQFQVPQRNFA